MLTAILTLGLLALIAGLLLGYAAMYFHVEGNPVVEKVDQLLPQLQCGKCGYAGCYGYAEAVVKSEAEINLCAPGGDSGMRAIASLLDRPLKPLAEEHPLTPVKKVAVIDEQLCIGCTLCLQACPVDAILGAAKQLHTVLSDECTGCELCVPPCPVDCIQMVKALSPAWRWPAPSSESVFE